MELLQSPAVKSTYDKCKYKVKYWEHHFKKKHGRLPSKLDIQEADREIRAAYKTYFNLKSAALEQSFQDIDGFNSDDDEKEAPPEKPPTPPPTVNTEKTWGAHLNMAVPEPDAGPKAKESPNVNRSFSQKLFKNSTLSKRNPRKSLSFHHRKSETNLASRQTLSQPTTEGGSTFESQVVVPNVVEVKFVSAPEPVAAKPINMYRDVLDGNVRSVRRLDAGWVGRAAVHSGVELEDDELEKFKARALSDKEDIIEDSDDDEASLHIAKRPKIDETHLQLPLQRASTEDTRKLDFTNIFNKSGESETTIVKPKINQPAATTKESTLKKNERNKATFVESKVNLPAVLTLKENKAAVATPQTRKSTRQRKTLVQLENDSSPADPFENSEDDDRDFIPSTDNTTATSQQSDDSPAKAPPPKITKRPKRKRGAQKEQRREEEDDTGSYELEFSVKPRIVTVPRIADLKSVVGARKKVAATDAVEPLVKSQHERELEKLKKKVEAGKLNENFVRVDLKKKVYARGKKTMNFSKYKKKMWKQKKNALTGPDMDMGGCDGGMLTCFNCGQVGHFAQKCTALKGDRLLPKEAVDDEEQCPFPTLEEASRMAKESDLTVRPSNRHCDDELGSDDEDAALLAEALRLEEHVRKIDMQQYVDQTRVVRPYYELKDDGSIIDTPSEVHETLRMFGHTSFRPGQEKAVMRILSGQSTLVTLSTGSGKSLCYQLPAYLYAQREPCIALIISPLVSLMEDQVTGVPAFLKAACLHTNKTKTQREKILEAIGTGSLDVLLVSPEAVVAGEKSTGFGSLLRKLPPVAFACIDEAHCVSQWSHNFRPSYLMICRILKERLGIHTILGLTATATCATSDSIIGHLSIPDGRAGIISDVPLPDNLRLTVSKDANRDQALLGLLTSERFQELRSVIVYCTRRQECERIASFLRTSLRTPAPKNDDGKKKKPIAYAEPYHAGLAASRRRTVQKNFMSGELRVVVATVAFGMGINKSDIRAVIHYNMPKNFESYVQEVGRAGRDGLPAHCHLFLDPSGRDENELQRHVYSDSIDRHVIRKLLQKIFVPCACKSTCPKHEVAFSIQGTVAALDIPEENISTLLCYLELHDERYVQVLSPAYTVCKVVAYGDGNLIRKAAKDCPPLAMALVMFGDKDGGGNAFEFPIVEVAAALGWDSGICKHKLKNLEWTSENNQPKRSLLTVQFENLGFRLLAPGNLSGEQLDGALDTLYRRVVDQERTALLQLHALHSIVTSTAARTYKSCLSEEASDAELRLKTTIRDYFANPEPLAELKLREKISDESVIANDVRAIVAMYRDNSFTGRAVARIFYGIPSPNYPAVVWGRCKFWRAHLNADFNLICRIATREILKMR